MLGVAAMAGAASFRHVHDWTMHNSPPGTGDWFGWANAMVSELIPLAAGLEARRRHRRYGKAGAYPIALILGAVALSLTGQFAEAKPGISGWIISAVPALGFLALVKLVLSRPTSPVSEPAEPAPEAVDAGPSDWHPTTQPHDHATFVVPEPGPATLTAEPASVDSTSRLEAPAHLIPGARFALAQHEQATGRAITADELAARMSLTPQVAGQLLTALGQPAAPATPARVNGHPVLGGDA
nr:hypothetical protein [Planosporangium mesophilum]